MSMLAISRMALLPTLWLLLAASLSAAELISQVDRTRIAENETLNLTLEYSEQVDSRQLDLSGLQQDFEILRNSTQTSVNIVNGRQSVATRWSLSLLPKRRGTLVIPSFRLGGDFSQAIEIEVTQSSAAGSRSRPLNVEISLDRPSAYAREQLLVTVKLTAAASVGNLTGDNLDVPGAEVYLLSQDRYAEMVEGANWQVIEWRYALFFDAPGNFEIPAQVFSGLVGSSRSVFDPFGSSGERVIARAAALAVEITPPPQDNDWLPANDLTISSVWPGGAGSIQVGEPVTRQIIIEAQGQRPEVIPPAPALALNQVRSYADQPRLSSDSNAGQLRSRRIESSALVATEAGEIRLPEIRIPWWDQNQRVWKQAVLPEETLLVQPAPAVQALAPPESGQSTEPTRTDALPRAAGYWPWISAALALLSILLLLDRMRLAGQIKRAPTNDRSAATAGAEQRAFRQLQQALTGTDAVAIEAALRRWLASGSEVAPHLAALQDRLDSQAAGQLHQLLQCCYGRSPAPLDAPPRALAEQLQALRSSGRAASGNQSGLMPLYPA